jgi:hypothetical protein
MDLATGHADEHLAAIRRKGECSDPRSHRETPALESLSRGQLPKPHLALCICRGEETTHG